MRFPLPKALLSGVCTAVLLISFGGCGSEKSPVDYLIDAVGGDPYALGEEGSRELARFNSVFGEYASQSQDGRFGHFSDAFKLQLRNLIQFTIRSTTRTPKRKVTVFVLLVLPLIEHVAANTQFYSQFAWQLVPLLQ